MKFKKMIQNRKRTIKKIISHMFNFGIQADPNEMVNDVSFIKKLTKRFKKIRKCVNIRPKVFLEKYSSLIDEYYLGREDEFESNWIKIFDSLSDDEKMIAIQLLFLTSAFGNKSSKKILDFAKTTNKNYRYWITQNIEKVTFYKQKGIYKEYYVDRKNLMVQICEDMNLKIPCVTSKEKDSDRIAKKLCIITYLLNKCIYNSMQRVAVMTANRMKKYYDEVLVLTLDSFAIGLNDDSDFGCFINYPDSISMQDEIKRHFNNGIKVQYSKGKNYYEKFQDAINKLYSYNPDLIIDITDEFSPISYLYSKDYTTVYLPLRYGPSSSFYDYIMIVKSVFMKWNEKYKFDSENRIIDWYFPEYIPPKTGLYTREELQIANDAFVIITIGACTNLCTKELADNMATLLENNEKILWLVVGGTVSNYMHEQYPDLFIKHRVVERSFEKNLMALCSICDVHLRLNTVGSGGATAIAAMSGLPVVMTNYICDPSSWLGLDYSDITNYKDLIRFIDNLYHDKDLYEEMKKRAKKLVSKVLDSEEKWDELNDLLNAIKKTSRENNQYEK